MDLVSPVGGGRDLGSQVVEIDMFGFACDAWLVFWRSSAAASCPVAIERRPTFVHGGKRGREMIWLVIAIMMGEVLRGRGL